MSAWLAFGFGVVAGVVLMNVIAIVLLPVLRQRAEAVHFHVTGGKPEPKS